MKLLIVRHGDPDYKIDSLTEKGWREAEYLAERLSKLEIAAFYVSPLGRAKDTASLTLSKMGRTATVCPWLREFNVLIERSDSPNKKSIPWDWLPQDWTVEDRFYSPEHWYEAEPMNQVKMDYDIVTDSLDELLEKHGYRREGRFYRVLRENSDIVVLFCHFGVECVLLSRLLGVSPMVLWHGFCAAPTSVTTLVTEERREGIAIWRMSAFGDVSHLYVHNEPPAFSARFRECFHNEYERMD